MEWVTHRLSWTIICQRVEIAKPAGVGLELVGLEAKTTRGFD